MSEPQDSTDVWGGGVVGHLDITDEDALAMAAYIKDMDDGEEVPWVGADRPGRYVIVHEGPDATYPCQEAGCEAEFDSMPEWQEHHREEHYGGDL